MKVLVTGGCGFIGSNLAKRCVGEGWTTDIVDDLSNGHREFMPPGIRDFFKSDFAQGTPVKRLQNGHYDVVFHLAAVPRVSYSVEHPIETNDVNVSRTLKLMQASRGNVKRIIFASSSSVYGGVDVSTGPTHENHPKNPKSPYALQKSIIEDYLAMYADLYGLDSACMRFFNVFGPNQLGDSPYSTAVSAWLTAIKKGKPMRSDGDGTQSRDMCYVDNVVDACVRAAKTDMPGGFRGRCYNVACGDRTTNNEIIKYLMKRYPKATKVDAPWRPGDVMHTQADVSRAKEDIGYVPLVSFWKGLEMTIKWYETNWSRIEHLGLKT
jgi:nucleoside-diphosphate-sugar epimerase